MSKDERKCKRCGQEKATYFFGKHHSTKDKINTRCKDCVNQVRKKRYRENKKTREKQTEHSRRWRLANNKIVVEYHKKWRHDNKDKISKYNKKRVSLLTDCYIKTLLTQRTLIKSSDIPSGLIEMKRAQMNIFRYGNNKN